MIRAKEARKEAREALNGKWKIAILISLLYSLVVFGIGLISSFLGVLRPIISIANIVIAPPLVYGMTYVYYHLKNGENVGYADFLTVGFNNFGRSWGIAWAIFCKCWYLIIIPIVIIIIIVGIGIGIYASAMQTVIKKDYSRSSTYSDYDYYDYYDYYDDYYDDDYYGYDYDDHTNNYNSNSVSNEELSNVFATVLGASAGTIIVVFIALIVYLIFVILAIRKMLLYSLSYYIAVENENMVPKQVVQESENLMKQNRGRLFCLLLSFIGWSILVGLAEYIFLSIPVAGLILGPIASVVGLSILTPYITFATLAFYRDLKMVNVNNNQNAYANSANMGQINYQSNVNNNMDNGYQVNNNHNIYNQNTNTMSNIQYQGNINNGYQVSNNQNLYNQNSNNNMQEHQNNQNTYIPDVNLQNETINRENIVPKKYCKKCGNESSQDAAFCTKCGEKLD